MNLYIKEWTDDTATLMTEHGRVVWTFASAQEAEEAARQYDSQQERDNDCAQKQSFGISAVA